MSFFSKLRERLTKSSSKIGTGLDDLIGQGTDAAAAAPRPAPEPAPTGASAAWSRSASGMMSMWCLAPPKHWARLPVAAARS
ncbi:hypothetical protein IX57_04150 [Paracoccus sanguinis]|nr:hypothetical protein IX57_04150 [Paracoccus sanguinis]